MMQPITIEPARCNPAARLPAPMPMDGPTSPESVAVGADGQRVLVTLSALSLPQVLMLHDQGARLVVTGNDPAAMSLAELSLPGAISHWANLRQSAELHALRAAVEQDGPVDRLILATDLNGATDALALMRLALTFLPSFKARGRGAILLVAPEGSAAAGTLTAFVQGLGNELADQGITLQVDLTV